MDAFTAKAYQIGKAPKRIQLFGDKTKKVESSQHIIEFPGGAIEVSCTSDGNYWAHILIDTEGTFGSSDVGEVRGKVVDTRIDSWGMVTNIQDGGNARQIAVLIKPVRD